MRRGFAVSAFALILAVPLWAQRGGAHGGGGHASFGSAHAGGFASHAHIGGGHSGSITSPRTAHSPAFSRRGFSRGSIITNRNRGHFRGNRLRSNCYGYACRSYGYPWGAGYYDPYWWWNNDSSYDDDYNQNLAIANEMNQQSLDEQRMMRQEESDGDQDVYARPSDSRPAAQEDRVTMPVLPPTLLVFRDGHQQEVQNYAIVGGTLWNFASHRTQKISLSSLDLPATEKANDDRGVTFRLPASAAGQ